MTKATIGFAMCGSFCTFSKAFTQMQRLVDSGYDVIPIMSQNAFSTSTRFGKAEETVKGRRNNGQSCSALGCADRTDRT